MNLAGNRSIMSRGDTKTPREIEAQAAAKQAKRGDLPLVEVYTLQYSSQQFRVGVPPFLPENTVFGKGCPAGCYVDVERGMVVYDFQVGDEYNEGGSDE